MMSERRPGGASRGECPVRARMVLAALALVASAMPVEASGQGLPWTDAWRWASFGADEGLPPGPVTALIQATDGTVWAATDSGLAWFDGFVWSVARSDGVPARRASRIAAGAGGTVLAVVHNQLYRGDTTGFERIPILVDADPGDDVAAKDRVVESVAPVGPDDFLVVIRETIDSLYGYPQALVRVTGGTTTVHEPPGPLDGSATLYPTRSGAVFLAVRGRVLRWRGDGWSDAFTLPDGAVPDALIEDGSEGVLGVVTQPVTARALVRADARGAVRTVRGEGSQPAVGVAAGSSGLVLVAYVSGRVRARVGARWADVPRFQPGQRHAVESVLVSDRGDVWFGTDAGVDLFRASAHRWTGRSFAFPDRRGIVNALLLDRGGDVWTGTDNGIVVHRMDRAEPEWIAEIGGRTLGAITGLAQDARGHVWAVSGSAFPGAYRWDGRAWRHFDDVDGLAAPRVHDVAVDRQGRPWFLGLGRQGADPGPGAFVLTDDGFQRWGVAEGLPSGRVYAFAEDSAGAYWFATAAGVSRWRRGEWTHWDRWHSPNPGGNAFRVPLLVRSLAAGRDGVWLGDRMLGVGRIGGDDTVRFWRGSGSLIGRDVRAVLEDGDGTVWATTAQGLCQAPATEPAWVCNGREVGLATASLWPVAVTRQGIYLGTQGEGLQVLSRSEQRDPAPRVRFGEPVVRGRTVTVGWRAHAFLGAVPPAAVLTRYRIDDGPWSRWSTVREVSLAGQRAGRHTVEVEGRALFEPATPAAASLGVVVPLPFVFRPAFALPVATLLLSLAAVGSVAIRHRRRTVRELRASEARFRSLGEASFEGIGFTGLGDIIEVNERLAEMFGYEREELVGRTYDVLVSPRSAAAVRELAQVMRRKDPREPPVRMEVWGRRRDGTEFPIEVQTKAMPLGDRLVRAVAVRDISARYDAEEALRRSEEKFAKAFWASPDAIDIAREADGRFIEVNEALARLHERPRDEMIGRSGAELALWADDGEREAYWAAVRERGSVHAFPARLRATSGEVRDCVISAERIQIGGETCVIALTRDVTEQVRTLAALRLTQFSVDKAGDSILWVDAAGVVRYANAAAAGTLGRSRDALVGSSVGSFSKAWAGDGWHEFWQLVRERGSILRAATWGSRNGQAIPVELLCSYLAAEGREHVVVSARDVSERVAAEDALLASEAKFATVFRTSPNGMLIVRAASGTVMEANPAARALVAGTRGSLVGRRMTDLGIWSESDGWDAFCDRVLAGTEAVQEVRLGEVAGARVALLSAEPLTLDGERCLLCVLQDVTDQVRNRQGLEESRRALRVLSRRLMEAQEAERARIARELHDEIGQTLAAVKLNLQAIARLTDHEGITGQVADGIAVVDATAVEVRNLSRDLRPSVLDDLGLAAALQWYVSRQAERAQLAIAFTPDPSLPRPRREVETACYRIVQEAITNVIRHADARNVRVEVDVDGADLVLAIRDDGRGFDAAAAPEQANGTESHLGLVGMHERAENAGGTLRIRSAPGGGTTIEARFRAAVQPTDAPADPAGSTA